MARLQALPTDAVMETLFRLLIDITAPVRKLARSPRRRRGGLSGVGWDPGVAADAAFDILAEPAGPGALRLH